ncbi:MAG TPA: hotdog domain-containing protein [Anaerolinea sp.]|nr:hotdog domain-containing protein [Anaerolinea sp.]
MPIPIFVTHHLVKGEDLNHHGTLYAGRSAEWFVESGFIAAAGITRPENIVCLKIHGMTFTRPVKRGEVIRMESRVIFTGKSRMVSFIQMKGRKPDDLIVQGFITFVHVDQEGKPLPHGIVIIPDTPEESDLQELARALN